MLRPAQTLSLLFGLLLVGCGQEKSSELSYPDWLTEDQTAAPADDPVQHSEASEESTGKTSLAEPQVAEAAAAETPRSSRRIGDRTHLIRTIETSLKQELPDGPQTHRSRLAVHFTLAVQAVEPDRSQIAVQFERIILDQSIGTTSRHGDTTDAETAGLPELAALRTLIGRGFAFWIDSQQQVLSVEGQEALLADAVGLVSTDLRAAVIAAFGTTTDLSMLMDESIGLSPQQLAPGDTWQRRLGKPLPSARRYNVRSADPDSVRLLITGEIGPLAGQPQEGSPRIDVIGGNYQGDCQIATATGLPVAASSIEIVQMRVQLPNGESFDQEKQTVCSLAVDPMAGNQATQPQPFPPATAEAGSRTADPSPSRQLGTASQVLAEVQAAAASFPNVQSNADVRPTIIPASGAAESDVTTVRQAFGEQTQSDRLSQGESVQPPPYFRR